jgi:ribonuclease R
MKKLREHPQRAILDSLLVRSMKQAVYDIANIGHFGLASTAYLHFTSPIRRYPDLSVHRAVKALLRGQEPERSDEAVARLRDAAVLASERERRAMHIEREVVDLHRALLMKDAIGDMYAGTVTGIVKSGLFVTIDEPFVEVLVRSDALGPDSYEADDDALAMVGGRSGERIEVGSTMMVQIEDVSIVRRSILGRRTSIPEREAEPKRKKKDGKVSAKGRRIPPRSAKTRPARGGGRRSR